VHNTQQIHQGFNIITHRFATAYQNSGTNSISQKKGRTLAFRTWKTS